MAFTLDQKSMRNILLGWSNLTRGDVSVVEMMLRTPDATAMTVAGTPHADFWLNLVVLKWAEKLYSPIDPIELEKEPLCFRLTKDGSYHLPKFMAQKQLFEIAMYNFSKCENERRQLRHVINTGGENAPGFGKTAKEKEG